MLIVCVNCRKIIGCGVNEDGALKNQCDFCQNLIECTNDTPTNCVMERHVLFIHFVNGCRDHNVNKIGFRLNSG